MADSVSSTSYSYLQTSNNRFSGLASGMDIDSIVEKLMKAESAKMEKLQQQKQKYEWQRDKYREINLKLDNFYNDAFDQFGLQKNLITRKTIVSDDSKLSATASEGVTGTLNISSVTQLATAGSNVQELKTKVINSKHTIADFIDATGSVDNVYDSNGMGSFTVTVAGETKTINFTKDETIDSFLKKLKDAGFTTAEITSDGALSIDTSGVTFNDTIGNTLLTKIENAAQNGIKANNATTLKDINISSGSITLNVLQSNGTMKETTITYSETDTLESFVKSINTSSAGITAIFSNGKMSLTSNATGYVAGGSIQVKTDDGNLFGTLGFTQNGSTFVANGTNAKYVINGIEKESTSNTISENGFNVTLKQAFTGNSVTITSSVDADGMLDKIKSFISMYNDLVDTLNTPLKEAKKYDFAPLTDAQKAEMKDEEIKKWEEQAKKGLLRNDSILSSALSGMREAIYSVNKNTTSPYNALFNIGITTTSTYSDGGKLKINDEQALKDAIAADPEAVAKIFTDSENGIIAKLRKVVDNASKSIDEKAGKSTDASTAYTIGRTINSLDSQIKDWKNRLKDIEERYYKQFSRMEEAINKANSQASLFFSGS